LGRPNQAEGVLPFTGIENSYTDTIIPKDDGLFIGDTPGSKSGDQAPILLSKTIASINKITNEHFDFSKNSEETSHSSRPSSSSSGEEHPHAAVKAPSGIVSPDRSISQAPIPPVEKGTEGLPSSPGSIDGSTLDTASPIFSRDSSMVRPEISKHDRSTLQEIYASNINSLNTTYLTVPKGKFSSTTISLNTRLRIIDKFLDLEPPVYFMVLFPRNNKFIGRTQKIRCIRDKLSEDKSIGRQCLAIWGLGGIGYDGSPIELNDYAY
jgi:hypothetical protein